MCIGYDNQPTDAVEEDDTIFTGLLPHDKNNRVKDSCCTWAKALSLRLTGKAKGNWVRQRGRENKSQPPPIFL